MKTSTTDRRRAQLRRAKQAQRARERAQGMVQAQLTLPRPLARKLRLAHRTATFASDLEGFLDGLLVRVADFPGLTRISWSLHDEYLTARDAFALYERNGKHLDRRRLGPAEVRLIRTLTERFGASSPPGPGFDSGADLARRVDEFIDECRSACLWYQRPDYYPRTRADRLRVLDAIQRHADRDTFIKAGRLKRCLSPGSNDASAGS